MAGINRPWWYFHPFSEGCVSVDVKKLVGGFSPKLWLFNIAMENGPFIDGLPIKNCDFPWLC